MSIKHCIKVDDFSKEEILNLFTLAADLKAKYRNKEEFKPFANHSMAMIFAKPSAEQGYHLKLAFLGWEDMQFIWLLKILALEKEKALQI